MALKFYWGIESNSDTLGAADYSAGDTVATPSNTSYGADGAKIGSYGIISAASVAANTSFDATTGILKASGDIDTAVGSCGYWWKAETTFPGNALANGLRVHSGTVGNGFRVQSLTGPKLQLIAQNPISQFAYASPTATLSANTWYFVIVRWDVPGNRMSLELYTDGGASTLAALANGSNENTADVAGVLNSTDFSTSAFTTIQFGVKSSSTAVRTFTDNIIVCDTYDAKIENNAFITSYTQYSDAVGVAPKAMYYYEMMRRA